LTSALDGGEWSAPRPGPFTPREKVELFVKISLIKEILLDILKPVSEPG
jgi:hypothetical protein